MRDATIIAGIRAKYFELLDDLDERGRRRWGRDGGYGSQAKGKRREGKTHGDGEGQCRHTAARVRARRRGGEPALSVDTKKKEVLGDLKNPGKTYRPKGHPTKVKAHDFP